MNPKNYMGSPSKREPEDARKGMAVERPQAEPRPQEAHVKAEQASRSVMHPESFDPDWRYYHGAMGG